jgi:hypothetical protein
LREQIIKYVERVDFTEMAGRGHEWTVHGKTIAKLDFTDMPTSDSTEL